MKKEVPQWVKQEERKRPERETKVGIAYIYATYNNTIVHITDMAGHTVSQVSGGQVTKYSRLKANPTTAMFIAKRAAEEIKEQGINSVYVRIKARTGETSSGPGAHAAIKSFSREGIRIINILDTTAVPRGGPKKKGGRRGRRV